MCSSHYQLKESHRFPGFGRSYRRDLALRHGVYSINRVCASFLPPFSITLSDKSDIDEHRLPALEKYRPTQAPADPPNPFLIANMPTPKNKSDYKARFDALKHEVEQALHSIVSRHIAESDCRLGEEGPGKRTILPSVFIANTGGDPGPESQTRVPWRSRLAVESPSLSCPSCLSLPLSATKDSKKIA